MTNDFLPASKEDGPLAVLVDNAREYVQAYFLAKRRHTGCEGTVRS